MSNTTTTARPHTFHIPVMGTGFTIDTPLRVAQWGIGSAISLVDDDLIERVRLHHARRLGRPATPISVREDDARARRITAYLDLIHDAVQDQIARIKASAFEPGSSVDRYFSMLPPGPLARAHQRLVNTPPGERAGLEQRLRNAVVPGAIEANIMTKIDRRFDVRGSPRPSELSDALAAMRGFCHSKGPATVVLSAGFNSRLFGYMSTFDVFYSGDGEQPEKEICLKVSDFRSALVQGSYLAKRGMWVSEYRVESGLNCGGHAFPTPGLLLGPILDQFRRERDALTARAFADLQEALADAGRFVPSEPPPVRITAQGGIGTAEEANLLRSHYGVERTGWGSPFLLVAEATRVDTTTRKRLVQARPRDIQRGASSPLGVPFWSLTTSESERTRRARIESGRPGSACPKGYLALELDKDGQPSCPASRAFIRQREREGPSSATELRKACICHDLAGGALLELNLVRDATPAVCPGPNLVNFDEFLSLEQMVAHIYGKNPRALLPDRKHMFIAELSLYVEELETRHAALEAPLSPRDQKMMRTWCQNLLEGIEHYRESSDQLTLARRTEFARELERARRRIEALEAPMGEASHDLSA